MILPIRTDRRLRSIPWVNYSLIAANAIIFLLTRHQIAELSQFTAQMQQQHVYLPSYVLIQKYPVFAYYLHPDNSHVYQFITYQFLHANWMHIIGNMIFLYVFGNAVEDRLGKVAYLFFYLAGGVIAGIGHSLIVASPVLGASGSIAAVTGAYLALFPLSNVTIIWFFFLVGAFEVPSIILILAEVGLNAYSQLTGGGHVAYLAHLFGYGFGFVVGMSMLLSGLLTREPQDMLALIEQRRRRASFRQMARQGYQPWQSQANQPPPTEAQGPPSAEQQRLMERRHAIASAIARHDMPAAARAYRELLSFDANQVMSQQAQLDIANQLMSEGSYEAAAQAYELFLQTYPGYNQTQQVQLILGLIYARYLHRSTRARKLLTDASKRLEGGDLELAQQVLGELS